MYSVQCSVPPVCVEVFGGMLGIRIWVEPASTSKPLAPPKPYINVKLSMQGLGVQYPLNYTRENTSVLFVQDVELRLSCILCLTVCRLKEKDEDWLQPRPAKKAKLGADPKAQRDRVEALAQVRALVVFLVG